MVHIEHILFNSEIIRSAQNNNVDITTPGENSNHREISIFYTQRWSDGSCITLNNLLSTRMLRVAPMYNNILFPWKWEQLNFLIEEQRQLWNLM